MKSILNTQQNVRSEKMKAIIAATGLILISSASLAESVLPAHTASPEVYSVLAENDQMRVILGTWQPGQSDTWHSHPASAVYYLDDCELKGMLPDGTVKKPSRKGGESRVRSNPVKNTKYSTGVIASAGF